MEQIFKKLFSAAVTVILTIVLIVVATYAWTTLTAAPEVGGIQVSIGGSNTILLAPDVSKTVDGKVLHHPGNFNDTLVFSRYESYDYLKKLDALSPVSTADGLNWYTPTFYDISDEEVKKGIASVGDLKPLSEFVCDSELNMANLESASSNGGHYAYLDFWVVSPKECTLRVSQGDRNGGSFLVELPTVKKDENGFSLSRTSGKTASCTRVGFLASANYCEDAVYAAYKNSRDYNSKYEKLAGTYNEKGQYGYSQNNRFSIYEPNGSLYPGAETERYVVTKPVGIVDGKVSLVDIKDRLSVQLGSFELEGAAASLDNLFAASIAGKNFKTAKEAETNFYEKYLQGQVSHYISKGEFVSYTDELYEKCLQSGKINATELASIRTSGATNDRYITKLFPNIPQRIRMFIWLEGQDADCTQLTYNVRLALSLELAGGSR